ncbi:MAG: hypothetical protein ABI833_20965 [Acidobacteriota bacterium]
MNGIQEITYILTRRRVRDHAAVQHHPVYSPPRIARLMALAIRFEGLIRDEAVKGYAELAQLGGVTRARMTQITKLLQLAPDLQEQLLFLREIKGLNERNLRAIVQQLDWSEQRRMFQKFMPR